MSPLIVFVLLMLIWGFPLFYIVQGMDNTVIAFIGLIASVLFGVVFFVYMALCSNDRMD